MGQKIINFLAFYEEIDVDICLQLVYNVKIILMIGGNTMLTDKEKQIIDEKMGFIKKTIKGLKHYDDPVKLAIEIDNWVKDISFFYDKLVPDGVDPSKIFYRIDPSKRPKEGQIAYINLRRGYPKEARDGHWCYILKDYGSKYIIIPSTSIKEYSSPCNTTCEMDIIDNTPNGTSRLHFSDTRSIDAMRVNTKVNPNFYDVKTPRKEIIDNLMKSMLDVGEDEC